MTIKLSLSLASVALCTLLAACGGGGGDDTLPPNNSTPPETSEPNPNVQGVIKGPFSTGSVNEPKFVYYDLDTQTVVQLTQEQAEQDTVWDIAFYRTKIYLNRHTDNLIKAHAMEHNSQFFDEEGKPIAEQFMNATAETELDDYLAVKTTDIPTNEQAFTGDTLNYILEGFYDYDMNTHVVSAADEHYFIVQTDEGYSKYRSTAITTEGFAMTEITLHNAYQGPGDSEFHAEQPLVIDTATACSADQIAVYIDLDTHQIVQGDDDWDIHIPCKEDNSGADFAIHLPEEGLAIRDFTNLYSLIDEANLAYYGFKPDQYVEHAFDAFSWFQYHLNKKHQLWSQFDTYLIQTPQATYKFQIISYYNDDGVSGHYSFRADLVDDLAGVAE